MRTSSIATLDHGRSGPVCNCSIFLSPRGRSRIRDGQTRVDYRHHRSGRLVPRRAAAREGLRSVRHGAALERAQLVADRAPARSRHAEAGRSARSVVPAPADRRSAAARTLQPRGHVVRAGVVGSADADRRVQLAGRDAHARRGSPGRSDHPLLSGLVERDVRQGARGAADRDDAVLSAQPVRRVEGVRALHHGELPRELRPVCRVRHAVQSRVAAARPRVRHAQGDATASRGSSSGWPTSCRSATWTRIATGALPATTSARCG